MLVTRKSNISGKVNTRDIDVNAEQWDEFVSGNGLIQNVLPDLSADDREFLLTGITPEEWDEVFADE